MAFGPKKREQMSVYVLEVDGKVRGRNLARLTQKADALFAQRFVSGAEIVHAEGDFRGAGNVWSRMHMPRAQAQHHAAALQQGQSRLMHDYLEPQFVFIELH